jgi:hypothetical protein
VLNTCEICDRLVDADAYDAAKHGALLCMGCDPISALRLDDSKAWVFANACRDNPAILHAAQSAFRLAGHEGVQRYAREVLASRREADAVRELTEEAERLGMYPEPKT